MFTLDNDFIVASRPAYEINTLIPPRREVFDRLIPFRLQQVPDEFLEIVGRQSSEIICCHWARQAPCRLFSLAAKSSARARSEEICAVPKFPYRVFHCHANVFNAVAWTNSLK
jgi:hypothetical protein